MSYSSHCGLFESGSRCFQCPFISVKEKSKEKACLYSIKLCFLFCLNGASQMVYKKYIKQDGDLPLCCLALTLASVNISLFIPQREQSTMEFTDSCLLIYLRTSSCSSHFFNCASSSKVLEVTVRCGNAFHPLYSGNFS